MAFCEGLKEVTTDDLVEIRKSIDEEIENRRRKCAQEASKEVSKTVQMLLQNVLRSNYIIIIKDGFGDEVEFIPEEAPGISVTAIPQG